MKNIEDTQKGEIQCYKRGERCLPDFVVLDEKVDVKTVCLMQEAEL